VSIILNPNFRQLFVTTALPYANAALHIGHMMEYIQADIWVRFLRMQGHEVHFIGADDAHGTPIMIGAEKAGLSPREFVAQTTATRKQYLEGFYIAFDNWHSTDSPENHEMSCDIYCKLRMSGFIVTKTVEQFFDPIKNMFLPDRYIKGDCPKCGAKDQYGDSCEVCSSVYNPTDLKNHYSTLTGTTPILKSSEHFFFKLSDPKCISFLRSWISGKTSGKSHLQPEVTNKAKEWLEGNDDMGDWDISRDAPYFGIEIPDEPGKYFYVWLDAPIGYLASLKNYFYKTGRDYNSFITDPRTEQYHFIGKDIAYFHTLFWPAILNFSGLKLPNGIFVHGFLRTSGKKMSKSRGTGISPLRYLELGMNPEWMRYYIATKISSKVEDIDFNQEDFVARINSDLIGKYINIASRASVFIAKIFAGKLSISSIDDSDSLLPKLRVVTNDIQRLYDSCQYNKAMRIIMEHADHVNAYIDLKKPWNMAKDPSKKVDLHGVCSRLLEAFRILTIYLKPVLPELAVQVESFLRIKPLVWSDVMQPLGNDHKINTYTHLMKRVDIKMWDTLFDI